ncbi:MAG TPA: LysR family transcriptional regulator [Terriglobales bacterium]|jgi:LysR family hydrogen peroxide-inducible transcriptional activator|nr:LysR family transcriptional regulator [Terriglobales bacterium]
MEIHQLRYFCAVVRAGSFTRAAEQLGIAQPSLSQQIRALEKRVGTPLFERLGRSIRLTASGEALRQQALDILRQVAEAESLLADLQHGVRGKLRVGVIPTIMPYWFAPRMREFLKTFPEVNLQLVEDTTPRLIEHLQSGELDIVVARLPVRNPDIVCSELFREPLFLAVAQGHALAGKRAVDLHVLRDERLLLLKEGHCLRDDVRMACSRAHAELRSIFETNQLESIFQLVRSDFGLTLVPAMASSYASGCTLIPLRGNIFRRIGYLRARRRFVSRPMREFVLWLRTLTKNQDRKSSGICAV